MKVYLDDVRDCPQGWVLARSADQAIELLETGKVEEISLDHDLGMKPKTLDSGVVEASEDTLAMSGYDVATWIEEQVIYRGFKAPRMKCHSANPIGVRRIQQVIESIQKITQSA